MSITTSVHDMCGLGDLGDLDDVDDALPDLEGDGDDYEDANLPPGSEPMSLVNAWKLRQIKLGIAQPHVARDEVTFTTVLLVFLPYNDSFRLPPIRV